MLDVLPAFGFLALKAIVEEQKTPISLNLTFLHYFPKKTTPNTSQT
jgi:hypothetical protein